MDLEALKTLLGDNVKKDDIIEMVSNTIKESNAYKAKVETLTTSLKDIGYDETKGIGALVKELKKKDNDIITSKSQSSTLEERLQQIEAELNSTKEREAKLSRENKQSKIMSDMKSKLDKKIHNSDAVIENLILKGKLDIVDNNIVYKDGDTVKAFDQAVNYIIEQQPKDNLKVTQKQGFDSSEMESFSESKLSNLASMSISDVSNNIDSIAKSMGITL
jgi:hypothetical protein